MIGVADDEALMMRIAARDAAAYRQLLEKYLGLSMRFAERMLGNRQDAEDIVQETYLKLWNDPGAWRQQSAFSTWVYRVLFNACMDHRRKVVRLVPAGDEMELFEDDAPAADIALGDKQRAQQMRQLLQRLPDRQRAALVLCYYEEASNEAAASILGIPLGALQQLLFRARQNLKQQLITQQVREAL